MITVFTPTFNRLPLLKKLSLSLEQQTTSDFTWLIIDDGSSDGTFEWIEQYKNNSKYKIMYVKQENQGKHIAFNTAIEKCQTKYMINVDSDDQVTSNAIKCIINCINNLNDEIGIIFPKKVNGEYDFDKWELINNRIVNIIDMKELYGIIETAILFDMSVLKNYRFPQFKRDDGDFEKFAPEGLLYCQLCDAGKFRLLNKCFYEADYQNDGLTNNLFAKTWINNFYGVIEAMKLRYKYVYCYPFPRNLISKTKCILNINSLCLLKKKNFLRFSPSKSLSIILFIPSLFFMKKRFR